MSSALKIYTDHENFVPNFFNLLCQHNSRFAAGYRKHKIIIITSSCLGLPRTKRDLTCASFGHDSCNMSCKLRGRASGTCEWNMETGAFNCNCSDVSKMISIETWKNWKICRTDVVSVAMLVEKGHANIHANLLVTLMAHVMRVSIAIVQVGDILVTCLHKCISGVGENSRWGSVLQNIGSSL